MILVGLAIGLVAGVVVVSFGRTSHDGDLVHRDEIDRVIRLNQERAFEEGRLYERRTREEA